MRNPSHASHGASSSCRRHRISTMGICARKVKGTHEGAEEEVTLAARLGRVQRGLERNPELEDEREGGHRDAGDRHQWWRGRRMQWICSQHWRGVNQGRLREA